MYLYVCITKRFELFQKRRYINIYYYYYVRNVNNDNHVEIVNPLETETQSCAFELSTYINMSLTEEVKIIS